MSRARLWLRHLLLPGVGFVLLAGTLIYGAVMGSFPGWLLGMSLCATVLVVLGTLWQERGSLRDSVASAVYAFFVLLCAVFVYLLAANHSRRIDLTRYQLNTLSDQTVALLRGIDKPIRVVAFAEPRHHGAYHEFFDLYEQHTRNVTFQVFDPNADIGVARQFDENVYPSYVYFLSTDDQGNERRHRTRLSMEDARRENKLSNGLLRAERGGEQKIYFTRGHNERPIRLADDARQEEAMLSLSFFAQVLQQNVMPVDEINLMTSSRIPADAALVVLASPTVDLLQLEREMLVEYLNEGGALMVMIEPEFGAGDLKDLESLLHHAGVSSPNSILIDQFAPQYLDVIAAPVPQHAIMREVPNGYVLTRQSRALEISPELSDAEGIAVSPLLATTELVWSRDPRELLGKRDLTPPDDKSLTHTHILGTASTFATPHAPRGSVARVVVFGDADFLGDARIPQGPSAIIGLNAVNWLVSREDMLSIPPKLIPKTSFQLPVNRLYVVLGVLLLIDLALLAGGIGYTVARRRMG